MPKLAVLQKKIFSSLTNNNDELIDTNYFEKNGVLSAEMGLSIYKNSLITTLLNSMRDTYDICVRLTGDDFFNAMAKIYMAQTPSYNENIDHYGETFSEFIADFPHAKELPYLSDVARLEWAWHKALHAKNIEPFNPETLIQLSEEDHPRIVFHLPPSMTLIASDYPINDIWRVNQKEYEEEPAVSLDKGGVKLLVWRQKMDTRIEILEENEWALLCALEQGLSMGELDDALDETQMTELSNLLASCVKRGWIAGYVLA
ncbi:MAG: hypothetical protein K0Q74_384 [Gammaproteobacteria bacterium]|jgi:hypothetical protein|nr:hypothetical protein [Gammaproteobacteria bacterium]